MTDELSDGREVRPEVGGGEEEEGGREIERIEKSCALQTQLNLLLHFQCSSDSRTMQLNLGVRVLRYKVESAPDAPLFQIVSSCGTKVWNIQAAGRDEMSAWVGDSPIIIIPIQPLLLQSTCHLLHTLSYHHLYA